MEQKPTVAEIGGYSNTPKSEPMGRTRVGPIRAYGESEIRMRPVEMLILAAKLKRLQRHGSRLVKVAIKRAMHAHGRKKYKPGVTLFPVYDMMSNVPNGPKPQGLTRRSLVEAVTFLRRGQRPSRADFPFGDGHSFTPLFTALLKEINDRILTPEGAAAHAKMVKEIVDSAKFEVDSRRIFGDTRSDIYNNLKKDEEKKDE